MSPQKESSLGGKNSIDEILLTCRLCGAGGGGEKSYKVPIIQKVIGLNDQDIELCRKIKECVLIEVTIDDKMPHLICELCIDKINDFYLFRFLCKETDNQTRMMLGLPPQNLSQSLVLESALSVTLQLCEHDSSDSEAISPRSTLTRTKRRLRAKSKQVEKQIPQIKWSRHSSPPFAIDNEPARNHSGPLRNQRSNVNVENNKIIRRAERKFIRKTSMSEEREEITSINQNISANETDDHLAVLQENIKYSSLKKNKDKQASIKEQDITMISDIESDSEMASDNKEIAAKTNKRDNKFNCDICTYSTEYKWDFKRHDRVHTDERPYKCNLCEYRGTCSGNLRRHKNTHTEDKSFKCSMCDYRCTQSGHLQIHKRKHTGEKPYKCNACEYRSTTSHHLKRHERTHTEEKLHKLSSIKRKNITENKDEQTPIDVKVKEIEAVEVPQEVLQHDSTKTTPVKQASIETPDPEMNITTKKIYKKNYISVSKSESNICTKYKDKIVRYEKTHTGEKPYKCYVCEYRCNRLDSLIAHKIIHTGEKTYKCNVCEYRCNRLDNLITHKRIHTGEKPYKCNVCEYSCTTSSYLKRHLSIHTGEKPYKCNVCEYSCTTSSQLKTHLRIHTREKPYKCNVCEYRCTQSSHLKKHLRTHTGEKPYKCNVCEYRCNQLTHLLIHERIHTGEKPYKCNVCEYRCTQSSVLKTHKRTFTGEKPYKCNVCEYRCAHSNSLNVHVRKHTLTK